MINKYAVNDFEIHQKTSLIQDYYMLNKFDNNNFYQMNDYHEYRNIKNQYIKAQIKSLRRSLNSRTHKILLPSITRAQNLDQQQQNHKTQPSEQNVQCKHKNIESISLIKKFKNRQELQVCEAQKKIQDNTRRDLIKSKIKKNIEKKIQNLLKNSIIRDTIGGIYQSQKNNNRISLRQSENTKENILNAIKQHRTPKHNTSEMNIKASKRITNNLPDVQTIIVTAENKKNSIIGQRKSIVTRNLRFKQMSPSQKIIYLKQEHKNYSIGRNNARLKKLISQSEHHVRQKIKYRSSAIEKIEDLITLKGKHNLSSIQKQKTAQFQYQPEIQPWDLQNKIQSNQFYA